MLAKISNRAIGEITFDAVTNEDHQSELSITENPIESGASIADHAVVQPKSITITGVMVDHNHQSSPLEQLDVPYIRGTLDFLNKVPLPVSIVNQTTQTIARANRVLSQVQGIASTVNDAVDSVRALAPWLPDFGLDGLLSTSDGDGRVQKCYADLLSCQKNGKTINVQTGLKLYENMLINSISVTQSQDGTATFTIACREIFIVDTSTVKSKGGKKTPQKTTTLGNKKSGRAAMQGAEKSQRGNVNIQSSTADKKSQSLLNKILGR